MITDEYDLFVWLLHHLKSKFDWFSIKTPNGSITNSELYYIFKYIIRLKNPIIFESGVGLCRSTAILSELVKILDGKLYVAYYRTKFDLNDMSGRVRSVSNDNVDIIYEKGEDAILNIEHADVSIIDGPKPDGFMWGNSGWDLLLKRSNNIVDVMFQHDIAKQTAYDIFSSVNHKKFVICKEFLENNKIFGCDEEWKETTENMGVIIINESIDSTYFTQWSKSSSYYQSRSNIGGGDHIC